MRLYGEIIPSFSEAIINRTGAKTMLYLSCTTISSVDPDQYGVSLAKDWVSVEYGTRSFGCSESNRVKEYFTNSC